MMRLTRRLMLPMIAFVFLGLTFSAMALESTAYTYTVSDDRRMIRTQDAYLPGSVLLREAGLMNPEDLHAVREWLFIADTGNHRIVRYHLKTGDTLMIGSEVLKAPTGVYSSPGGDIYVADYAAALIQVFSPDGRHIKSIGQPETAAYGSKAFKPQKLAADSFGNLYVTTETNYEGVLQYDPQGRYAGFFGANQAGGLSLIEWIQETFFTQAQKEKLFSRNPPRIVNLEVSEEDLVYTVTQLNERQALKKLNMAGVNILHAPDFMGERNFVDVALLPGNLMVAVTETGAIVEYDAQGRYLFGFGGRAVSSDRNGLTSVVSAIGADDEGNLYLLDKQRGLVLPYLQTDFARRAHQGLSLYQEGEYAQAAEIWREYLRTSPRAAFVHRGYGLALWQMKAYDEARSHLARVREMNYLSDTFWEQRNAWLQKNLACILIALVLASALGALLRKQHRKTGVLKPLSNGWKALKARIPLLSNLLSVRRMMRHPIDTAYAIRHEGSGSPAAAGLLYLMALLVWALDMAFSATLFNNGLFSAPGANPIIAITALMVPGALFIVGNYYISSINDGKGKLRHVFITLAYALAPYILLTPFITLLTHALTLNEAFINRFLRMFSVGYTGALIFVALQEIHSFTFWQTIKNILLTLAFVILAILAIMILYMMWHELISFVLTLVEEVSLRA